MAKPVIVWFRHDLRLDDHPALTAAVAAGQPVICLYIYEKGIMGAASQWWLHHSLKKLETTLTIREGKAAEILKSVIQETGATALYWNREYDPVSVARDTDIKTSLQSQGIDVQSFKGNVLFEPWEVKTGAGTPFKVFTPFYKACLASIHLIGKALPAPANINKHPCKTLKIENLKLLPTIPWDQGFGTIWQPGEQGAHTRLQQFIESPMATYKVDRDFPNIEATSRLSPHLHFGEISHRRVWHTAEPHAGHEPFLRELAWREFSIHLLYYNTGMKTEPLNPKFSNFPWQINNNHLKAWQHGQTGYPIVDAGMRQLWQTGWMHNRVRMIVGSFLVKHLLQPWQHGEEWFWDTLVDADYANNTASWQWIAGCGADAAPYFRVFNPIIQGKKFDPDGAYVRRFVPELKNVPTDYIHTPWEWMGKTNYPKPIIEHSAGRNRALEAYAKIKNNNE